MNGFDFAKFDEEWTELGRQICQAIYIHPEVQKLKDNLQKSGFLSLEEKSKFINTCDTVKYKVIYETFGKEGTPGYQSFSEFWKEWFSLKGVESEKKRGQKSSVDHILFGSTPDPVQFLLHFEHEMLGSMKD